MSSGTMERQELELRLADLQARDPEARLPDALKALQQGRAGTTPLEHLASCQKLLALAQVAGITQPHVLRWPLLMQSQLELARAYGRVGCLPQAVQHASDSLESAEEALTEGCLDRAEEAQVAQLQCACMRLSAELQLQLYSTCGSRTCLEASLAYFQAVSPVLAQLGAEVGMCAEAGLPDSVCDLFQKDPDLARSVGLCYAHLGREQLVLLQRMHRQGVELSVEAAATQRQRDSALDGTATFEKASKHLNGLSAKRAGVNQDFAPTADAIAHALNLAILILYSYKDSVAAQQQPLSLQPQHASNVRPGNECERVQGMTLVRDVWHAINRAMVDLASVHHVCASLKDTLESTGRQAYTGQLLQGSAELLRETAQKLLREVLASKHECPGAVPHVLAGQVERLMSLQAAES